ncbi:MAG: fibronectin type III domain-containing protein [Bacteroidales bacterium]|nr:fibronectin type III domain-containing protein [Bacteroidales bacterium]
MRKFTFITFFFSFLITFTVFAQKGYINPAAKYAEILGYRYEVTSAKGGEVGIVHLPDGRMVNAWDFFKGKEAPEYSYGAKLGFEVETEVIKQNGYTIERAVCVRANKGVEERIPLLELMELNGDPLNAEVERTVPSIQEIAKVDPSFTSSKSLPTEFDWRNYNGHTYIGDVRDQGGCGSCYAFGASAAAEGVYNFATGSYDSNTADFSEGWIAFCLSEISPYSSHFDGCNGADYDYYELQALVDIGHIDESYFPYSDANNQSCPSTTDAAPKIQFEGWYRVPCADVDAIKTAIMTYGVVDAAVYVTTAFSGYSGGVFTDSYTTCNTNPCYNATTNHAIALVGWGVDATDGEYWILRNSWGSSWGEGGYMKLSVNASHVDCSVCYMVYADDGTTTATVTTNTVTGIGDNVATCGGNITDDGGNAVLASGLVYSKTPDVNTSNGTVLETSPTVTNGSYSLTMNGLLSGTVYYVNSFATNAKGTSYGTERSFATTGEAQIEYCPSQGTDYSYEWIGGVVVGDFSNTSGAAGYTDFTNLTAELVSGESYNITLTPAFSGSTYDEYWKIWIDLNHDGDFDDADENVFDQGGMSKTVVTGSFTIPASTAAVTTRMRVTMKYNAAPDACEATFSYGEVEDYTVQIIGGDTEAPTAPANLIASNITMTSVELDWNASTDNVGVTGYDVYQNGSVITSTANTYYNVSGLNSGASYSYYVIAKDAVGNESDASNTANITTDTDTQAPTAPANLSSSNITSNSVALTWSASTDNVGVTGYDVYKDGAYFASTSATSYNVTGLSIATSYAFYVKAKDAAGNISAASSSINVTTLDEVIVVDYCDLYSTSARFEWIDVFGLNDLYNTSAANNGYGDFTNLTANVSQGTSYTASLSAGFKRRLYTEYWNVWIDFNIDGEFTSDELVIQGTVANGDVYTATVDIPETATIGQTRIRAAMSDAGYPAACGSFKYGEVEDYTVNIIAKATFVATAVNGKQLGHDEVKNINLYPNPAKDELTVQIPFDNARVKIINSTGAIVKEIVLNRDENTINISDLVSGLYILSVDDEKGPITEMFIKK